MLKRLETRLTKQNMFTVGRLDNMSTVVKYSIFYHSIIPHHYLIISFLAPSQDVRQLTFSPVIIVRLSYDMFDLIPT